MECAYKIEKPLCGIYRYRNVYDYCNVLVAAINRECKFVYVIPSRKCEKCVEYQLTVKRLKNSDEWELIMPPEAPVT